MPFLRAESLRGTWATLLLPISEDDSIDLARLAAEIETRLRSFFDRHFVPFITDRSYSNPAVDKLLAAIGGWSDIGTRLRWPYRSIDPAEALRLRPLLHTHLPELAPHP